MHNAGRDWMGVERDCGKGRERERDVRGGGGVESEVERGRRRGEEVEVEGG